MWHVVIFKHYVYALQRRVYALAYCAITYLIWNTYYHYMGLLPETSCRNKHILVIVDHFNKCCKAFATPDQKTSTLILVSRIFSRFSPPAVLHSDQGQNFESTLLHEICNFMGITKTHTTSHHTQCDKTIEAMLSMFASNRRDHWDLWLDSVTFAYNTSTHATLSISPYLVYNQLPRLPVELELGMTQSEHLVSVRMPFKDGILGCKTHSRGAFVKSIRKAGIAQSANKHLAAFQIG